MIVSVLILNALIEGKIHVIVLNFPGYKGTRCEIDVNECEDQTANCGDRGTCKNENGTYRCECLADVCGYNCHLSDPCRVSFIFQYNTYMIAAKMVLVGILPGIIPIIVDPWFESIFLQVWIPNSLYSGVTSHNM